MKQMFSLAYFMLFYFMFFGVIFADTKVGVPNIPNTQMPKNPTMPQVEAPKIEIPKEPSKSNENAIKTTTLKTLIDDAIKNSMILDSACIPDKIAPQSKLNVKEVRQLGMQLQLNTEQYRDNLLRLQDLALKPTNSQNTTNTEGLAGVLIVIRFLDKGLQKHIIALSLNYLQIDNEILKSNPQIFRIFQTYFCNTNIK